MAPKIVFLDKAAFASQLARLELDHNWVNYDRSDTPELIIERLQGATVAITNVVSITAKILDACPSVRLVAVAATGYDQVDVAACKSRGVAVCNVRGWAVSVVEHVFAMTLALRRQIPTYSKALAEGAWQRAPNHTLILGSMPLAVSGSTMGIVGYGALGKRVENVASAFGMKVIIAERRGVTQPRNGRVSLEVVIKTSDVLVLLCPMNEETRGLIGDAELRSMKSDALLINCARGAIVDEVALAHALDEGTIAGAGVDVLGEEPPRDGNPLLDRVRTNLIVTPHMGWASRESLAILIQQLVDNIEAFLEGRPQNLV